MYSVRDYCDMYLKYGRCNGNTLRTAREYAPRHPSRRPPDVNVIRRLDGRLRNKRSALPTANLHDSGRPRSDLTVAQVNARLQRVEEAPEVSTRALAREMTSSKSTVHRLVRSERLHPFRYTTVEGLKPDDFQKRVAFCEWLLQQQNTYNGFIAHTLCTDGSCFTRDGIFNHHSCHMWSQVNPHAIRPQKHQEHWSLNVWAGILRDRLLGSYMLPERLSGQSHLVFLNEVLTEFLDDISLAEIQRLWFHHDGAPAHFCAPDGNTKRAMCTVLFLVASTSDDMPQHFTIK
ncbi:hypothetical protein X975_19681, partial [Stegodyphus mimosarum]